MSYLFKNWENKILILNSLKISLLNWNIIQFSYFLKNVSILDFVILDTDLAINRYCLWSWHYSAHSLPYAIVFWEKLFLLACFAFSEYAVFIWILGFQWLMQIHGSKDLQDYTKPCSSCKTIHNYLFIIKMTTRK